MILPQVRDKRLITLRRGGSFSDQDHHALAVWAARCAERVLPHFYAIKAVRWAQGGQEGTKAEHDEWLWQIEQVPPSLRELILGIRGTGTQFAGTRLRPRPRPAGKPLSWQILPVPLQ